jgi:hypothetical protein
VPTTSTRTQARRLRDTYPQGMFFSWEVYRKRPSNSVFQTARGSGATLSDALFPKSAHHSKISRSATWFLSSKHLDDTCFLSARPRGTRRGFQDQPYSARGLPYLARQLSVFGDRQLVTRLPGTIIRGYRRMQNLMVNAETTIYTGSVYRNNLGVPTSSVG